MVWSLSVLGSDFVPLIEEVERFRSLHLFFDQSTNLNLDSSRGFASGLSSG